VITHARDPSNNLFVITPSCINKKGHLLVAIYILFSGVIPERLERSTYSLEGCCSIQLSYGTRERFANLKKNSKMPAGGFG
jgi:hypothetical protein